MGHKAHPLALRISSKTRRQDTHMYSRRYRDTLLLQYISVNTYLHTIGDSIGYPRPRMAYQSGHRGLYVYPFYCTTEDQRALGVQCRVLDSRKTAPVGTNHIRAYSNPIPWTSLVSMPSYYPNIPVLSSTHLVEWAISLYTTSHSQVDTSYDMSFGIHDVPQDIKHQSYEPTPLWLHTFIATTIESAYKVPVQYIPFRVNSMWKNASYVADAIVWCMERRVRFSMVKRVCAQHVQTIPDILGVRIACAGRVGGRSKKSQRARRDVWKYGATPLHVYTREIEYAQRTAHTPLGSMGVSVWLYRRNISHSLDTSMDIGFHHRS